MWDVWYAMSLIVCVLSACWGLTDKKDMCHGDETSPWKFSLGATTMKDVIGEKYRSCPGLLTVQC